ncbi:MAG TPA: polynucleotide adenylyltransferase PcnB [Polyangiaceae bacterium]|jgi:poly(A) polymerase|nr:polynucleotide adenylyltransferase PcnB [Polyangiaceae bacterium]
MVLGSPPLLVPNQDEDTRGSPQPTRFDAGFDQSRVDPDAQKVVRRLTRHGFQAYLVGGGVRDLLLDRRPKDFDIATDARPEDVRRLFRNSRIIGRRFRLVHVLFGGGKVIEVATFRRSPIIDVDSLDGSDPDLLIRSDNAFGEAHEDAVRRDFTINALFYDLDAGQVLDWVGGMADIERRVVRTIGEPETRFREDPIRILRAIKFSARLDLGIDPDVYDAMVFTRATLARAARPRLFEEILRLLRGGGAHRSIWLAWELGILSVLLPELATFLDDDAGNGASTRVWKLLAEVDRRTLERGTPFDDIVLSTLLLLEPMREACEGERDRVAAAYGFLDPVIARLAMSRRVADAVRRIVSILPRLGANRAGRFARSGLADLATQIYEIERAARGD